MSASRFPLRRAAFTGALIAAAWVSSPVHTARADVTVEQQTSMNVAGMNIQTTTVERTSGDKQRRDLSTHCQGLLSLLCGNAQSGQIVRLDKQMQWDLQPRKRLYTQLQFPTPEERAQAQQRYQQLIEQMKQCPAPQPQGAGSAAPDTSHCQLSAPTINVSRSDEHASVAGHDTQKSNVVLSQTCTDAQTGDVCEIDYGFNVWLTSDALPGADERNAFSRNYLAAQGLDPNNPQLQGMAQQFMAPYADALKQLQSKASVLQGYPLRTMFYMAFGGPHCARASQAQTSASSAPPRRRGFGLGGLASSAVGGGLSGLFARHGADAATSAAAGQVGANAAGAASDAASSSTTSSATSSPASAGGPAGTDSSMHQIMAMTTETTSIDTGAIAPEQFELPSDWKLQPPAPQGNQQFVCPTTSH